MAQYPDEIFTPRLKENRRGIVYDENKKHFLFAEDLTKIEDEVIELEQRLTPGTGKLLPYGVGVGSENTAMALMEIETEDGFIPVLLPFDDLGNPQATVIGYGLNIINPDGDPVIALTNGLTGQQNFFTITGDGLFSVGGLSSFREEADEDTGIKEVIRMSGRVIGGSSVGSKTGLVITDKVGTGIGTTVRLGFLYGKINDVGTDWKGGICIGIFKKADPTTPVEIIDIDGDGKTTIKDDLSVSGDVNIASGKTLKIGNTTLTEQNIIDLLDLL
jgi:hypothetical protein